MRTPPAPDRPQDGPPVQVLAVSGDALLPHLEALARLRIEVFRQWPYLYDGDLEYERRYLQTYARTPDAVCVLAHAGDQVVGAATGLPLVHAEAAMRAPLVAAGFAPESVFYFGESVLLPAWRGLGLGHAFFDGREAFARGLNQRAHAAGQPAALTTTAFCGVLRAADDPRRPEAARDLEPFWRARGYAPHPAVQAHFAWREVGGTAEVAHALMFWSRPLAP